MQPFVPVVFAMLAPLLALPAHAQIEVFICNDRSTTYFQGEKCGAERKATSILMPGTGTFHDPATGVTKSYDFRGIRGWRGEVSYVGVPVSAIAAPPAAAATQSSNAQAMADQEARRRASIDERMAQAQALRRNGTIGGMMDARAIQDQLIAEQGVPPPPRPVIIQPNPTTLNCRPNALGGMTCSPY